MFHNLPNSDNDMDYRIFEFSLKFNACVMTDLFLHGPMGIHVRTGPGGLDV